MATRMQQRRGTAAQWISTNAGAGPVLNAGEIGWESDTNKFKIGDGTNNWASLDYFADINSTVNPAFGTSITFEGATADSYETIIQVTDPTADRTITFPDSSGTVALTTDIAAGTVTETGTQTLTNKTLTSPVVSGLTLSDSGIVIEGSSADAHETTLTVTNPTADRTITFPDETGTVQLRVTDVSDTEIGYLNGVTSAIQTQIDLKAPLAAPALTGNATAVNLTISGNLTVNGTTTNINSTNLVVEDKNIVLADVETPTDTTADGGGITLKGATDKTFNWVDATDSWTSSEHINLASGKSLYLNGTLLKDVSETLTNKTLTTPVISSISNTGTLTLPTDTDTLVGRATTDTLTNKTLGSAVATTAFTLNATAELRLADTDSSHYVGFKAPGTVSANKIWTLPAADGAAGQVLTTDGSGVFSFSTPAAGAAFSELMLIGA